MIVKSDIWVFCHLIGEKTDHPWLGSFIPVWYFHADIWKLKFDTTGVINCLKHVCKIRKHPLLKKSLEQWFPVCMPQVNVWKAIYKLFYTYLKNKKDLEFYYHAWCCLSWPLESMTGEKSGERKSTLSRDILVLRLPLFLAYYSRWHLHVPLLKEFINFMVSFY